MVPVAVPRTEPLTCIKSRYVAEGLVPVNDMSAIRINITGLPNSRKYFPKELLFAPMGHIRY